MPFYGADIDGAGGRKCPPFRAGGEPGSKIFLRIGKKNRIKNL